MRILIILTLITLTTSTLVIAKTKHTKSNNIITVSIEKLHHALTNVKHKSHDRNSILRLERAKFYYQQAKIYHSSGRDAKAKDFAQRGILLIELHQRAISKQNMLAVR